VSLKRKNDLVTATHDLFKGAVTAQILLFTVTPLLTRLYSSAEFGEFAVVCSIVMLLSPFVIGSLDRAIPLASSDTEASNYIVLAIVRVLTIGFILFSIIYCLRVFEVMPLSTATMLIPLMVAASAFWLITNSMAQRLKHFREQALARVMQACTLCGVQLTAVYLGAIGLILGFVSGYIGGAIFLAYLLLKKSGTFNANWGLEILKAAAVKSKGFARHVAPAVTLNVAGREVGLYYLAFRVVLTPLALVIETYNRVIYRESRDQQSAGDLGQFLAAVVSHLYSLGVPFAIIGIYVLEPLFIVIFGEDWMVSGQVAVRLVPWAVISMIVVPLLGTYSVIDRQVAGLKFETLSFALRCATLIVAPLFYDFIVVVVLYSFVASICLIVQAAWIFKETGATRYLSKYNLHRVTVFSVFILCSIFIFEKYFSSALMIIVLGVLCFLVTLRGAFMLCQVQGIR